MITIDLNGFNPVWITVAIAAVAAILTAGIWIGKVNSDRESFRKFMQEVRKDFTNIRQDISDLKNLVVERLTSKQYIVTESPAPLTDYGKSLSESANARGLAEEFADQVSIDSDMNAYRIQEACFDFTRDKLPGMLDENATRNLEDIAYKEGIDMAGLFRIVGIELRDLMLDRHDKGKDEVDERDPGKT